MLFILNSLNFHSSLFTLHHYFLQLLNSPLLFSFTSTPFCFCFAWKSISLWEHFCPLLTISRKFQPTPTNSQRNSAKKWTKSNFLFRPKNSSTTQEGWKKLWWESWRKGTPSLRDLKDWWQRRRVFTYVSFYFILHPFNRLCSFTFALGCWSDGQKK